MKKAEVELSRPLAVDRVPPGGSDESIEASPEECAALAGRLGLLAIHGLHAHMKVNPWRGGLKIEGKLVVDLDRESVVSLEPFSSRLEFGIERFFLPSSEMPPDEDCDADPITGREIDLGEVVAETLALELDPYPRKPGESFGVSHDSSEDRPQSPFSALSKLTRK